MEHELDDRVRAMFQEKLQEGVQCNNADCILQATCERFYDPLRKENQNQPEVAESGLVRYDPDRDDCFVLRRRLTGDLAIHREWTKTTKRHRRRGGNWS